MDFFDIMACSVLVLQVFGSLWLSQAICRSVFSAGVGRRKLMKDRGR